jgi:hypothetical protein
LSNIFAFEARLLAKVGDFLKTDRVIPQKNGIIGCTAIRWKQQKSARPFARKEAFRHDKKIVDFTHVMLTE